VAGEYLPPITQEFRGDASNLLKSIAEVDAAYEGLGKQSHKTSEGIGKDEKESGKAVSDFQRLLGDKLKEGETGLEALQRELTDTRTKVTGLRDDLRRTGNIEIFGDLKQAEADLKHLEGFMNDMKPKIDQKAHSLGVSAGDEFIRGLPFGIGAGAMALGKAFVKLFGGVGPQVVQEAEKLGVKAGQALGDGVASAGDALAQDVPALFTPEGAVGAAIVVVIGTMLAPAIAGAVAAAVTSAVGLGVLGLGAYLTKNDAGIKAAAGRLKDDVLGVFTSGASVLLTPVEEALQKLDGFFKSGASHITALFSAVAPAVAPVESMFESMVSSIGPALVNVARTFTEVFSDPSFQSDVKGLGQNIAAFFDTIARNKDAVEISLKVIMGLLSEVLGILNVLINTAGKLTAPLRWADGLINGGNQTKAVWHDATDSLSSFVAVTEKAAPSVEQLTQKLNAQVVTADTLAGQMTDKLVNSVLNSQMAELHFQEALTKVTKTLHANHDALKITTAAGQADREAILAVVQANLAQYDSMIQVGVSAKDAAAAYDANTKALETQLRKAGLLPSQINSIIGAYKNVPDKVNTTIALQGLTDAINNLDNLLRRLNGLPPLTTVTVHAKVIADKLPDYVHRGTSIAFAQGGVVRAAQGLVSGILPPRSPGTLVLAGERGTGGEVFMPLRGINPARAMSLAQVAGDAYGFDAVPRGRSYAYAGAGGVSTVVVPVYVGGKYITTVHADLMQYSQRFKARTGSTGLT